MDSIHIYSVIVWSFKILITFVLVLSDLFLLFCGDSVLINTYKLKDTIFVKLCCIIGELQGLKVEQFPIDLL